MTLKNNRAPLLCYFKLCASFRSHWWIQTGVTVRKRLSWVVTSVTLTFDLWPWTFAWTLRWSLVISPENFKMIRWWEHSQQDRRWNADKPSAALDPYIPTWLTTSPANHRPDNFWFFFLHSKEIVKSGATSGPIDQHQLQIWSSRSLTAWFLVFPIDVENKSTIENINIYRYIYAYIAIHWVFGIIFSRSLPLKTVVYRNLPGGR